METIYIEYFFKKDPSLLEKIIRNWLVAIGVLLIVFAFLYPFLLTIGIFLLVLAYYYNKSLKREIEYILSGDDLGIDRIIAKEKRKKLLRLDLNKLILLDYYQKQHLKRTYINKLNQHTYVLTYQDDSGIKDYLVDFNEEIVLKIKDLYPDKVKL